MRARTNIILALSSLLSFSADAAPARDLPFEERVEAQRAIERVYYTHQIGTSKSFEDAVSRDVLEKKVRTYLKQSAALEKFWHTPVTAEALQRELERIARNTRFPDRLQEIYSSWRNASSGRYWRIGFPAASLLQTSGFMELDAPRGTHGGPTTLENSPNPPSMR